MVTTSVGKTLGACLLGLILCLWLSVYSFAQDGAFTPTGPMGTSRWLHTATLLQNGKVLITGGTTLRPDGSSDELSSAELYDPATGAFSPTGSMTTKRGGHTATLLSDGKVLIAGGNFRGVSLASAELYDPLTETFSPTGSMTTPREVFTTALSPGGNILVLGGLYLPAATTAEVYDPASGTFSSTSNNPGGTCIECTATLLTNGKVLIAGGSNLPTGNAAALYDPNKMTFSPTGSMAAARILHTATRISNGEVVVAGGFNALSGYLSGAELYDPAMGNFRPTGPLRTGRAYQTATLLPDGQVLIAGGFDQFQYLSSAELYNPTTGAFNLTRSMITGRAYHTATLLPNGTVLIAGGVGNFTEYYHHAVLALAELYAPEELFISIDIKPGDAKNTINLKSQGVVGVAILGSATFDPLSVDPSTVTLAGAPVATRGRGVLMSSQGDFNHDGYIDLLLQFRTQALQLDSTATEAVLYGDTTTGQRIRGADSVRMIQLPIKGPAPRAPFERPRRAPAPPFEP